MRLCTRSPRKSLRVRRRQKATKSCTPPCYSYTLGHHASHSSIRLTQSTVMHQYFQVSLFLFVAVCLVDRLGIHDPVSAFSNPYQLFTKCNSNLPTRTANLASTSLNKAAQVMQSMAVFQPKKPNLIRLHCKFSVDEPGQRQLW